MNALFLRTGLSFAASLAAMLTTPAFAAEPGYPTKREPPPPASPPFDVGFGVKFGSDYMFRGLTQTNGKPTVQGYVEARLLDWFYAGMFMSNVSFPAYPWGLADPAAELDYMAGLRHTWDRFTLDVGIVYFTYPGQISKGALGNGLPTNNMNMWEASVKPSYAINDTVTIGGMIAHSPSYVGTGASETYLAGNIKINLPKLTSFGGWGWYMSGEFGYEWLGKTDFKNFYVADTKLPDYALWNAGIAFTYKSMTVDFRYWGSTLKNGPRKSCFAAISIDNACGDRFVATLAFDTSLAALK